MEREPGNVVERSRRNCHKHCHNATDANVDHRGPAVRVAEQLLNRANVVACGKEVGCEYMPQRVTARALGDPARPHRLVNRHYPLRLSRRGHIVDPRTSFTVEGDLPAIGQFYDLILLQGGSTFLSGAIPSDANYEFQVNPVPGVGLRAIRRQ